MAKRINLNPIPSIEERALQSTVMDSDGNPVMVGDVPQTRDATVIDMLEVLIWRFPADRMTMENITHGTRLKTQLLEAKKADNGVMVLEEAEHDWVKKMLKDEGVGPKIFGFNLIAIIEAVENFDKLHEPKEKEHAVTSGEPES